MNAITEEQREVRASRSTRNARHMTPSKRQWLEDRRTYIGATDAGAILGVNPYVSPHDVWLDKKGLRADETNIPMRLGTYMEPFIAQEWQRKTGIKVLRSRTYRHSKHEWAGCNPDREVVIDGVRGLLECKSVGHWASKNFGSDGSDQIPEHYLMQCLWQLLVTGHKFVHLVALVDNREIRTFNYTLDPSMSGSAHVFPHEMAVRVFSVCGQFWNHNILGDVEPVMTGHDSDTEWLRSERATYENGQLVNTDETTDRECELLPKALRRYARAKEVLEGRKNRIKRFMSENGASVLESSVGTFTWKTNVKGVATFNTPFRSERA